VGEQLPTVLVVDPDPDTVFMLQAAIGPRAASRGCCDFVTARHVLIESAPELLIANVRLEAFNGLHLAHLILSLRMATRAVIYADRDDPLVAREVQAAGAFFERRTRLPYVLAGYVTSRLPLRDRRDAPLYDRRRRHRGGRRPLDAYWRSAAG
jgi:hypothetical protein